jgi:Ca-activated chloride channel family protein
MIPANILPDNFRRLFRLALVCALLCGAGSAALAQPQQTPPPPQDDEETVRVDTNLIVLNVGVADRRGAPVLNLSQRDFVVYEDGVRQQIVNFEPASAPFSLVILLDVSGSTQNFRTTLKHSALRFVDALHPEDRVAVVTFNAKTKTRAGFTTDRKKIAFAISEIPNERGDTYLYEALQYSLDMLAKEGQRRRKAIVVLTDGVDTQNQNLDRGATANAQTNEAAVASVKPEENAALRRVLDAADRQGVTIYPLALPSGDPRRLLPLTPQQAAIYTAARARMDSLATRTGGRLHEITRVEDIGRLYAEVAADMRTLYSIAYQSSNAGPRDGRWRAINVEVTRPETIARARPGYYAR